MRFNLISWVVWALQLAFKLSPTWIRQNRRAFGVGQAIRCAPLLPHHVSSDVGTDPATHELCRVLRVRRLWLFSRETTARSEAVHGMLALVGWTMGKLGTWMELPKQPGSTCI